MYMYICTNQVICKVDEGRKEDLESRISRPLKLTADRLAEPMSI